MSKAKVFVFDIETLPCTGTFWRPGYQISVPYDNITKHSQMAMWSGKYLGDKKIYTMNGHDHGHENMVAELWKHLDESHAVVAHNGNRFDRKWANTEFLLNGHTPPSVAKWIDTLTVARGQFNFESNRLDAIADTLGVGRKIKTEYSLWQDWMKGDKKAIRKMTKYCNQDVMVLQGVYYKLRPWIRRHPNLAIMSDPQGRPTCGHCGNTKVVNKGLSYTSGGVYRRWKCTDCGTNLKSRKTQISVEDKNNCLMEDA